MSARVALWLLLPALAVNLAAFLAPMVNLFGYSLHEVSSSGAILPGLSAGTWTALLQDSFYVELVITTVVTALGVTALTLLLSYPLALFVHRANPRVKNLLIVACLSPLLISAVVRTYGWLVILGDRGVIPALMRALGWDHPPKMVFNQTGVTIGLVQILMPYMILCLLAGFGRLNPALEEAAGSLGAPPWTVFRRIVLPLSLPGILLGFLLCFVLTVSSFITPKLLGGGRVFLLATEIYDQAIVTLNWPLAAALSLVTLVIFGLTLALYGRAARALEQA
jgi:putative spermidine/putrescine transport system permease protein